jgi:hypothetical protein
MHDPAANNLQWHTKRSDCDRSSWLMRNPQKPRLLSSAFMQQQDFQMLNTGVKSFVISALAVLRRHPTTENATRRTRQIASKRRSPETSAGQTFHTTHRLREALTLAAALECGK